MKKVLWILAAVGICLVAAAALLADEGAKAGEDAARRSNKKEAGETVVPMKEKDGNWKVAGYFIK